MDDFRMPPADVTEVAARLAKPKPMRRGSISERFMKCGQATCRCHKDPAARHGPYVSVTRMVKGKTSSRYLTVEQAKLARRQSEAGQQFRKDVEIYWQACERWADEELDAAQAVSDAGAAKKRASGKPSKRKLSPRSKRS
jgi:hypothetical protein